MFESFGFKYIGPVDGHDIDLLIKILGRIKNMNCPVLLHIVTKKGKGYEYAEKTPELYHGLGAFDKEKQRCCIYTDRLVGYVVLRDVF